MQIIDNLPKDTKGHVLLFLHLGPDGAVQYGKQSLQALLVQARPGFIATC